MFERRWIPIASLAVVAMLAGSCSSSGSSSTPNAGPPASQSSSGGSYGGGSGGYGGGGGGNGGGGNGGGGASVATVTQANYAFSPAKLTVKSGDTITVTDGTSSTPHTFTIDGQNVNVMNSPNQSQDVTLDLKPGTYTFFCTYHRSQGMTGTLTVT